MIPKARRLIGRRLFLWAPSRRLWYHLEHLRWRSGGRPATSSPALFKQRLVAAYAERFSCRTLVETGTFLGDMIAAQRWHFRALYSVELDPTLHRRATERFHRLPHIRLLQGDSGQVLANLLPELEGRVLFWLDAHQMIGGVRGAKTSPILEELNLILASRLDDYVLLIDDARLFTGDDYPSLDDVRAQIHRRHPRWVAEVEHDVIRAHRPAR